MQWSSRGIDLCHNQKMQYKDYVPIIFLKMQYKDYEPINCLQDCIKISLCLCSIFFIVGRREGGAGEGAVSRL